MDVAEGLVIGVVVMQSAWETRQHLRHFRVPNLRRSDSNQEAATAAQLCTTSITWRKDSKRML